MGFIRSHVAHVFVAVFVVLFCYELAFRVEGVTFERFVNIGGAITLTCFPLEHEINYNSWYRNETLIANKRGISIDSPRIKQRYSDFNQKYSSYELSIADANIYDSAIYICSTLYGNVIQSYDVHVVGCSNCFLTPHTNEDEEKVICNLDNYWASQQLDRYISLHGNVYRMAVIQRNVFSFSIYINELSKLRFEFYLVIASNAVTDWRITCMLSTPLTTSQPSIHQTTTVTSKSTTLIQTIQNRRLTSTSKSSQELSPGTPISTVIHHTSLSKNTNINGQSYIIIIIVIAGSVVMLILIVLIVVLRCKQTKNRQENKHNGTVSVDGKATKEHPEACYESVEDASQRGSQNATSLDKMSETTGDQPSADHNGGMIDNILYDSSDRIADSFISRTEGPLDNALYAMPDKKGTLNRESRSRVIDGSSNADILYGNSIIISQQEQKRDTLQRGDQYENVGMPGSGAGGAAEEIPLYAMPDKAPQRNTLKATPKAEQTSTLSKDEVIDVDALYAEVDKTKKK